MRESYTDRETDVTEHQTTISHPLTDDERDQRAWRLRQQFVGACRNAATGGAA
jgi:hypothetical protein